MNLTEFRVKIFIKSRNQFHASHRSWSFELNILLRTNCIFLLLDPYPNGNGLSVPPFSL